MIRRFSRTRAGRISMIVVGSVTVALTVLLLSEPALAREIMPVLSFGGY